MTNPINTAEVILKTDERGRVQTPAVRRESLLDEFERSGLTNHQINEVTPEAWAKQQKQKLQSVAA